MKGGVALIGTRYSGKNYVAEKIVAEIKYLRPDATVTCHAMADAIKRAYCEENPGVDLELMLTDREYKEKFRAGLIELGMRQRAIHPDYWIERAMEHLDACTSDFAVFTDVRFTDELDALIDRGFIAVRLKVSDATRAARGWIPSEIDTHVSETTCLGMETDLTARNETERDANGISGWASRWLTSAARQEEALTTPDIEE